MGCDAFADENGEFVLEIRDYDTGRVMDTVVWNFSDGRHGVDIEILKGDWR